MRHHLFLSYDAVAALAALTKRQQTVIFRALDALTHFPHAGELVAGENRKDPTYTRQFGVWRIVWWVDEPVNEVQILAILRAR